MESRKPESPRKVDRRTFVSSIAAAGASLYLTGLSRSEIPAGNGEILRKIHVFSKPFGWLGYEDMAILLAEAGAEGIDITVRPEGHVLPGNVESDLPRAVAAARKHGLAVEMIVTGIVGADRSAESVIRTASSLGIKYYRLGWINYDNTLGIKGTIEKCRSDLKKLEEMNRKYGIHGAYQNHAGTMVGAAVWDIYEILKDLDPQFMGCQYDVRHAIVEGGTSWPNGLKLIAPWVRCTDIKDFKWEEKNGKWSPVSVPLGKGMVDYEEYFTIIKSFNIKGPMSLHFEYPPFENSALSLDDSGKRTLLMNEARKDIDLLKSYRSKYGL
jgi:L-ribulose-5-phosphate 3-epimerase